MARITVRPAKSPSLLGADMAFADRVLGIITIAAEASSESEECQQAIAGSFRNRVKAGRWEPSIAGVVVQRYQYSEFLPDAGDNANLERVANLPDDAPEIITAANAYDTVMADPNFDPSGNATHFYADGILPPKWAVAPARLTKKIGGISFFTNVA